MVKSYYGLEKIKELIKNILFKTPRGRLFFYRIRVYREKLAIALRSDYQYVKTEYKKRYKKEIDLKNPQWISEKLQWLKLFYRNDQMPVCSDKYALRFFLKKHHYENLINPYITICKTPEEIDDLDISTLPESFVVKATHGSGWNLVVEDKDSIDWKTWKQIFKQWLKLDLSVFGREWNYREATPKIIVEHFIDYHPLIDYKLTCFNGVPKYVQVNSKKNGQTYVDFYDMNWNKMNVTLRQYIRSDYTLPPPPQFDKMIKIASELSDEFPFVRVDFYNFDEKIFIGEMTFFPGGGLLPFYPNTEKVEQELGSLLTLPEPNHNLDLYEKIQLNKA